MTCAARDEGDGAWDPAPGRISTFGPTAAWSGRKTPETVVVRFETEIGQACRAASGVARKLIAMRL